ncbi:hypothetical protein GGTG_11945 [Gaeumannomyces tritici R3-111a-1]|uniref:Uncharacterized protein n=1 Tax=Gaeumannomyces tritici (strain R3-111a-1) TaxID=644352 RepID=J3PEL4_GAET3|nr:hypothetical protein GGTG_11945 [Gaeumannomyces tritici R3-111a-1]EJT70922.1 hypothetical protein GGTG_11945 [Gaeumannomyces tritici R3-111a-1]
MSTPEPKYGDPNGPAVEGRGPEKRLGSAWQQQASPSSLPTPPKLSLRDFPSSDTSPALLKSRLSDKATSQSSTKEGKRGETRLSVLHD